MKSLLVCQTVLGQMRAPCERHTRCWVFLLPWRSSESHFTKTSVLIYGGSRCSCLIPSRFGGVHGGAQNLTGGSPEQAAAADPALSKGVTLTSLLRCLSSTVITWHSVVLPKAERITPRPCFFIACSSCWIQTWELNDSHRSWSRLCGYLQAWVLVVFSSFIMLLQRLFREVSVYLSFLQSRCK